MRVGSGAWLVIALLGSGVLPLPAVAGGDPPAGEAEEAERASEEEGEPARSSRSPSFRDEIVVTATRSEWEAERLPVSATVVGRHEIDHAPVPRVDELLRDVPGVNLPPAGSEVQNPAFNTVSMRGLGGRRALVLVDGVPVQQPMLGFVSWHKLDLHDIERAEVVRGAGGSVFGGQAMGGTIQLFSRPLGDRELSVDTSIGSHQTWRASARATHRVSPALAVGASLSAAESDGFHRIPEEQRGPFDTESEWSSASARLRAEWTPSPNVSSLLRIGYFSNELSWGTPLDGSEDRSTDLAVTLRLAEVMGGELAVNAYYEDQDYLVDQVRTLPDGSLLFRSSHQDSPSEAAGASVVWTGSIGPDLPQLVVGTDLRSLTARTDRTDFDSDGAVSGAQASGGRQESVGLFAQAAWAPAARLEVLGSARADWWRNHGGFHRVEDGSDEAFESASTLQLSPRLALRFDVGGGLAVRGAVYRAFGPPVLRDLYRPTAFRDQVVLSNPRLDPETLLGGELGLDLSIPRVRAELNVFTNRIEDLITRVALSAGPPRIVQPHNLGAARSRGGEVLGEAYLAAAWRASASYAYTDARTVESPETPELEGLRLPGVARHTASVRLAYTAPRGLAVSARATYTGRLFADAENLLPLGDHWIFDLSASRPLGGGLSVHVGVANLLNERYVAEIIPLERLGAPRQVRVGLRWRGGDG